jgi:transcriptional regulator with XRE-family HTH domain
MVDILEVPVPVPSDTFGAQLRAMRLKTLDPRTGRKLSQEEFGFLVGVSSQTINNWENDRDGPRVQDRDRQLLIIRVLYEHHGLRESEEANHLLRLRNYRGLNEQERASIFVKETAAFWQGNPYVGLDAYRPDQFPIFFGREQETAGMVERLVAQRHTSLIGASGSGKTSLVNAGVLPELIRRVGDRWQLLHFTPYQHDTPSVFMSLIWTLQHSYKSYRYDQAQFRQQPDSLTRWLDAFMAAHPATEQVLLVIDQFEELCMAGTEEDQRQFGALLAEAMLSPYLRTLVIVRSDVAAQCRSSLPEGLIDQPVVLPEHFAEHRLHDLREIITRPAAVAGIRIEAGLPDRLLLTFGSEANVLAWLNVCLHQLAAACEPDGVMTQAAYDARGGAAGLIREHLKHALPAFDADQQAERDGLFSRLVSLSHSDSGKAAIPSSKARRQSQIGAEGLIQTLTHARLLVEDQDEQGEPTLSIAPRILFEAWEPLADWVRQQRDGRQPAGGGKLWQKVGLRIGASAISVLILLPMFLKLTHLTIGVTLDPREEITGFMLEVAVNIFVSSLIILALGWIEQRGYSMRQRAWMLPLITSVGIGLLMLIIIPATMWREHPQDTLFGGTFGGALAGIIAHFALPEQPDWRKWPSQLLRGILVVELFAQVANVYFVLYNIQVKGLSLAEALNSAIGTSMLGAAWIISLILGLALGDWLAGISPN